MYPRDRGARLNSVERSVRASSAFDWRGDRFDEAEALDNRRLLYHIMTSQGFTNDLEEWWHFDFGGQFWGKISGKRSIYSGRESVA